MKNKRTHGIYITISAAAAIAVAGALLTACGDDKPPAQTPDKYSVAYSLDGGVGTLPTETDKAAGEKFTLAAATGLTKEDYTFDGWHDGAVKYDAGAEYTMPAHSVTFTAQWKPDEGSDPSDVEFKIVYEYNLGEVPHGGTVKPSTGATGSSVTVKDGRAFNPRGYKFVGWSTKPDGIVSLTGTKEDGQYLAGETIVMGESDITLYAQWAVEYADAREASADKICVYKPLIGKGLGAAILVRSGKADKLGFVESSESTKSGYDEFEFFFDESEGGNLVGRLYADNTYAAIDGTQGVYLQYDYVYKDNGLYVLATDGYGFATISEIVGSQTAVRFSGYYEYDKQYGDYTYVFKNEETNATGQSYFTIEKSEVSGTSFDGRFRLQGEESGSYLLYDNGELLNYRLDANGYGFAKIYAYDSVSQTTELVASGTYCGTENYDGFLGEWEFTPTTGDGFKFILNVLYVGTDVVPVYVEYNPDYARTFTAESGDGTLVLDGYIGATYTTGGAKYDGNVTVGENLITFVPYEDDGEGGATAGAAMYFNVNWENNTFKVNTTGFVIDGTTLIDYKGTSKIIEIPDEVTEIADGACNYVNTDVSLVSVTIPASVTAIGKLAFQNQYTLRRAVFLSPTPINIDFSNEANPFRWGAGDMTIVVPEGSQDAYKAAWTNCPFAIKGSVEVTKLPEFEIVDGVLVRYNKQPDTAELLDIVIPAEVTEISAKAFRGFEFVRSVNLTNVEKIGDGAFESCVNLETVVMNKVKVLADGAFSNCYKLGSTANGVIELPAIVTVGANAFQSCIALKLVKFGASLAEIGDMAFRECHIFENEPALFIELDGVTPPSMGEKVSTGNISFRIKVKNIDVAIACFEAAGWNSYCRHLYIESGAERGKYMCGAELLDIDGRATFQSTYLMMYKIDGAKITFYEYDASIGDYSTYEGTIENDVISVNFYNTDYEFRKVNGVVTYTTADGKYTLKCDPLALLPESYENNQGEATVEFNGVNVKMSVNGFGTKKILDFTDSDGKRYDITITFDGNTLVVKKSPAEIFIRNITAADGSVINLHYSGTLVYVFGELKINVGTETEPKYIVWSDLGAIALFSADDENVFTFSVRYLNVKYTVTVTLNAERTTFEYTYTAQ